MKFLLDMGLARSTATFLRGRGHDAIHLRHEGLQLNFYLSEVLDRFAAQLEVGALVSVNEHSIRVRPLPISK
ncbi:MAG: hypothetical protein ACRDGG_07350 [Anaerolineae bacterium]